MTANNAAIVLIGIALVMLTACQKDEPVDMGPSTDPQYTGAEQDAQKENPGREQKSDTPDDALPSAPDPTMEVLTEPSVPLPAPELTIGQARVEGERLAAQWFNATKLGDAEAITAMSDAPFWWDNEMQTSLAELRQTLDSFYQERRSNPEQWQRMQSLKIDRFETMTIPEYVAAGYAAGDRVIRRLSLDDDDIAVAVFIGGEGVALFFRNANGKLKLVGLWD